MVAWAQVSITTQPQPVTALVGQPATFGVAVAATGTLGGTTGTALVEVYELP